MKKRSFKSIFPPVRSRSRRRKASAAIIGLLSALGAISSANAATQTWSGTASGIWDTTALNWDAGAATWTNGNDALFSGTPTNNVTTATGLTIATITLDNTFTGSVTMSGVNTVTGATSISGGTLNLNNATGLGTSAITVNSGGTLAINPGTASTTVANTVSGAGALTLQDPGAAAGNTLTLSGVYSGFTGTVNILAGASNNGKVNFSNATQANVLSSSATVQIQNGATLYLNKGLNYGASVQILGAGNSENLGALRLEAGANQTGSVTLMGSSASIGANATAATISGNIGESGGSFGFSKVGNSTLTLSGTNTYSGVTTMSAGTTQFAKEVSLYNNNTANWTATNLVVASGATAAFNVGGTGEFTTSDINTLIGLGTATGGFKSGSSIGFDTTNAGGSFTYSNNIANTNAGANTLGVTKLGTGALTLPGTLTNTGGTTVSAGTLNYTGSGSSLGALTVNSSGVNSTVNFASGAGTYVYNNVNFLVGNNATAAGVVNHSAGAISGVNQLQIGAVTGGSYGYYNLSGGSLGIQELDLGGFNGAPNGRMDVSGGTLNDSAWLIVARGSGGSALLNMTGGAVNYTGTTAGRLILNFNANASQSATINVANSTFAATNATGGILDLMRSGSAGERGTVNLLSGGVMQVQGLKASNATGTSSLNFNGGTLKASTANTTFVTGLSTANVYSGGGTIDNNGVNITVGQALVAPAGFGVSSSTVSVPSGGSGYVGAPLVTLSGGTGSGATGYATVSGGVVTGIVITSPGIGYTSGDTLTATFTGGGATVAASSVTGIAVAANTSGGMTFAGTGTTTLSGANTYTGSTTINAGTLALANTGSLASTTFNIAAGATYDVSSQAYSLNGKAITLSLDAVNPGFIKDLGQTLTLTGGALTLNLTTASPGSSYALYSGTTSGDFSSILLTGSGFSGNLSFSGGVWTGTSNGFDFSLVESTGILSLTAVPESNAYGIAAGVFCLVLLAARRRRAMLE